MATSIISISFIASVIIAAVLYYVTSMSHTCKQYYIYQIFPNGFAFVDANLSMYISFCVLGNHISIKIQKLTENKSDSCFAYNKTLFFLIK